MRTRVRQIGMECRFGQPQAALRTAQGEAHGWAESIPPSPPRCKAAELRRRFNDAYWMDDLEFFAMGLDPRQRQIRSLGSNALH